MKLILSRKGFDASWGGCASPILEDGSLLSLPIPDRCSPVAYRDLRDDRGEPMAPIVTQLSRGRIRAHHGAHLDPDLRRNSLRHSAGWQPVFGQAGAAQAHLSRHNVGSGDLFLFFGWFRRVKLAARRFRFVPGAPDLHVIFGWMQVGEVVTISDATKRQIPWAAYHPHLGERKLYTGNTLYIASPFLTALESHLPGAGAFAQFRPELRLTDMDPYVGRSRWRLPRCFEPRGRQPLSRHGDLTRWQLAGDGSIRLRTVPIGQEFVLDLATYPEASEWLCSIFAGLRT